jgi:hypothetical protein
MQVIGKISREMYQGKGISIFQLRFYDKKGCLANSLNNTNCLQESFIQMSELNHTAASIAFNETLGDTNERVNNRGTRIDEYVRYAGLRVSADPSRSGAQYCGCFVYWCYGTAAMRCGGRNPLTHAVRGGGAFADWAESHHSGNIVYRHGDGSVNLEAGDIFVVLNRSHVGMVASFAGGNNSHLVQSTFPTIEGNMADPSINSRNLQGVRRRPSRSLASVLLIYRP